MITPRYLDDALSAKYRLDFHRAYYGEHVDWRQWNTPLPVCDECTALIAEGKREVVNNAETQRDTTRSTLNLCATHAKMWTYRDLYTGPLDKPGSV